MTASSTARGPGERKSPGGGGRAGGFFVPQGGVGVDAVSSERIVIPVEPAGRAPAPPRPSGALRAEDVPEAAKPQPTPLIRLIMPLVMVAAMGAVVIVVVTSAGEVSPMMLLFPLMMAMGFVMMLSPQQADDPDESRRSYLRHLEGLRQQALRNGRAQRDHEEHRYPPAGALWALAAGERLWERGAGDEDAADVRVATGRTALCTPIEVGEVKSAEDLDPVCAVALRHTLKSVGALDDMPVVVKLTAFPVVSIAGPAAREAAYAIVAQLAFHHGPETIGVEVVEEPGAPGAWGWAKWLPHTRRPAEAAIRVLVVDGPATVGTEGFLRGGHDVVVEVASGAATWLRGRAVEEGLALHAGVRLVVATARGEEELGAPERLGAAAAERLARALNGCRRPARGGEGRAGGLTELLGLGPAAALTAEGLWGAQGERLAVPIGVAPGSARPVVLDLKESAQGGVGPHGLCIGATGSGKSELLRTLVTALALTHSPEELNVVLVDFKGGATFLGLEGLPHTAAVITNLAAEAPLVERMRDALSGELNRRQELLRAAGNAAGVAQYREARERDPGLPALPSLLVVIDEFSELLSQHPEFADLFVAIGRLGRSLGVHILLASQRLDEGRMRGLDSHLSYRIGLRTFSAAESRQVIGTPDAYELPATPGAGFLAAGSGEPERFQAGYVSGPLEPPGQAGGAAEPGLRVFESWESLDAAPRPAAEEPEADPAGAGESLLERAVALCAAAAGGRGMAAHRVWLPPLPERVPLAGIAAPGEDLSAAIGIIDRPFEQRQDPLRVALGEGSGHLAVAGAPRSGKSSTLVTLVASLCATHGPDVLKVYVLALGGAEPAALARLPHVAAVAGKDEPERLARVVDEVRALAADAQAGRPGDGRHTLLVVDGWHALTEEFEELAAGVTALGSEGPAAGVHLAISANRWSSIRPALRDLIDHRLELRLGEPMESLVDRRAQEKLPVKPGRALTAGGEQALVALTSGEDLAHVARSALEAGHEPVPRLRTLPKEVTTGELEAPPAGEGGGYAVPIGVGGTRLATLAWEDTHLLIVGGRGSGKTTALATVLEAVQLWDRASARVVLVDPRRAHLGRVAEEMLAAYAASASQAADAIADTCLTLKERLPGPGISPAQLAERSWWAGPEIFLVIDDLDLVPEAHLAGLVELLPHAPDIGLHVVAARKAGGVGRALFQAFLAALADQRPALLLLDAPAEEGPVLGVKPGPKPPGRGAWRAGGAEPTTIQVAAPGGEAGSGGRHAAAAGAAQ